MPYKLVLPSINFIPCIIFLVLCTLSLLVCSFLFIVIETRVNRSLHPARPKQAAFTCRGLTRKYQAAGDSLKAA